MRLLIFSLIFLMCFMCTTIHAEGQLQTPYPWIFCIIGISANTNATEPNNKLTKDELKLCDDNYIEIDKCKLYNELYEKLQKNPDKYIDCVDWIYHVVDIPMCP